ncbi:hypothetical protein DVH24_028154 [Malus domestica]|uniref:Uncharacterized protein n=1 Tax=Malus domestica TaxID=3750 RepID=A0A498HF92_MALDO|nr:hypothetical protein DVH24_028154 [Malus domestica]
MASIGFKTTNCRSLATRILIVRLLWRMMIRLMLGMISQARVMHQILWIVLLNKSGVDWVQDNQLQTTSNKALDNKTTDADGDSFDAWNDFASSKNASNLADNSVKQSINQTTSVDHTSETNLFGTSSSSDLDFGSFLQPDFSPGALNSSNSSTVVDRVHLEPSVLDRLADASTNDGKKSEDVVEGGDVSSVRAGSKSDDVERIMSEMHDLSFMLESTLSIPPKNQRNILEVFFYTAIRMTVIGRVGKAGSVGQPCDHSKHHKAVSHALIARSWFNQNREFHVFLFPFMSHGHMIPISDMAKLFAAQGVKTTIVTTPLNASTFYKATQSSKTNSGSVKVEIKTIKFPSEAGLPDGCEILDSLASPELSTNFLKATSLLQEPLEQLLLDQNPSFLLADICFPWATDAAAKFDIPRLVFHGTSFFALAASYNMSKYEPFKNSSSDLEPFVIPNFPGEITMTRAQVPAFDKENIENDVTRMLKRAKESEQTSYGIVSHT